MKKSVLLIVTSHDRLGDTGERTGFWLEELAAPYQVFREAGFEIDIASPKGGRAPADPKSEKSDSPAVAAFLADAEARAKLEGTLPLAEVARHYDAYFVVGGHGVMWDLAEDATLQRMLGSAFDAGRVVAAVCHGPAALVRVKVSGDQSLVAGRRVTGFSDEEERAVKLDGVVPFPLEGTLRELGGRYERGAIWSAYAVRDGRLITGQNPASSSVAAKEVVAALG